jgi:hypothetical protein
VNWDVIAEDIKGFRWQRLPESARVLLASNALTIIVAILFGLDPAEIIWVYWLESVVIGAYTVLAFIMMARAPKSSRNEGTPAGAYGYAIFFIIHYGMFHGVYAVFLLAMPWFNITHPDLLGMGITAGILALSHGFSFVKNVLGNPAEIARTKGNMDRVMMAPYSRIIPMHLTIIFSGFLMVPLAFLEVIAGAIWSGPGLAAADWLIKFVVLLLFMGIKTAADLQTHLGRYQ